MGRTGLGLRVQRSGSVRDVAVRFAPSPYTRKSKKPQALGPSIPEPAT